MSLLNSDVKLAAQILGLIILIIKLILALRKFKTNNTGTTTQPLPGGNLASSDGVTSSSQDNIQLMASECRSGCLNLQYTITMWCFISFGASSGEKSRSFIKLKHGGVHGIYAFVGLFQLCRINCLCEVWGLQFSSASVLYYCIAFYFFYPFLFGWNCMYCVDLLCFVLWLNNEHGDFTPNLPAGVYFSLFSYKSCSDFTTKPVHYKKNGLLRRSKTATKAQKSAAKGPFDLLRRVLLRRAVPSVLQCRYK